MKFESGGKSAELVYEYDTTKSLKEDLKENLKKISDEKIKTIDEISKLKGYIANLECQIRAKEEIVARLDKDFAETQAVIIMIL